MGRQYSMLGWAVSRDEPVVVFAVDAEGVFTLSEGSGLEVLGLKAVGRYAFEAYDGEPLVADSLRRALSGEAFDSTVEASGTVFECHYHPLKDGDAVVVGAMGVGVALGGRDWACEERGTLLGANGAEMREDGLRRLERGEERYRLVAKATKEVIWDSNLLTDLQVWDGAVEEVFGYPTGQATDWAWWEQHVHPNDRERVLSKVGTVLRPHGAETWSDEYRFRRADGSYAVVVDRCFVLRHPETGQPVRMLGSMTEVTGARRAEEALKQSEERYRSAFDNAPVSMAHVSPDGRFLRVNDRFCRISGYGRGELVGMTFQEITPPEELEACLARVGRALKGGTGGYSVDRRFVRKDGARVWIDLSVSLARKPSGAPDFFVCVAEDITERKVRELIPDPLTHREVEVLRLMAVGLANPQIAKDLALSLGTVKLCAQRIIAKLRVENRRQASFRAIEIGLVPSQHS